MRAFILCYGVAAVSVDAGAFVDRPHLLRGCQTAETATQLAALNHEEDQSCSCTEDCVGSAGSWGQTCWRSRKDCQTKCHCRLGRR